MQSPTSWNNWLESHLSLLVWIADLRFHLLSRLPAVLLLLWPGTDLSADLSSSVPVPSLGLTVLFWERTAHRWSHMCDCGKGLVTCVTCYNVKFWNTRLWLRGKELPQRSESLLGRNWDGRVMPAYHGSVLDFRFAALSLHIWFKVPWSLLLKVVLSFSGVTVLSQAGEVIINQGP